MKITGIKETIQALDELSQKMEKTIVRRASRAGCRPIQSAAVGEAPEISGLTKRSIKIRSGGTRSGAYHATVGVSKKDFTGEAFYASFVLYGHYVGSRKLGDNRTYVKPDNWLQRAYDSSKEAAVDAFSTSLKEQVEDAANKV